MGTSLMSKLFGTKQEKDIKALGPIVEAVNSEEAWAQSLDSDQFKAETARFKARIPPHLHEEFAPFVVRELQVA